MRIFLTGATGVVGRRVVPLFAASGHDVTAAVRTPDKAPALMRAGFHSSFRMLVLKDGAVTSLYRFPDGWKIVSKIFHVHPVS